MITLVTKATTNTTQRKMPVYIHDGTVNRRAYIDCEHSAIGVSIFIIVQKSSMHWFEVNTAAHQRAYTLWCIEKVCIGPQSTWQHKSVHFQEPYSVTFLVIERWLLLDIEGYPLGGTLAATVKVSTLYFFFANTLEREKLVILTCHLLIPQSKRRIIYSLAWGGSMPSANSETSDVLGVNKQECRRWKHNKR